MDPAINETRDWLNRYHMRFSGKYNLNSNYFHVNLQVRAANNLIILISPPRSDAGTP